MGKQKKKKTRAEEEKEEEGESNREVTELDAVTNGDSCEKKKKKKKKNKEAEQNDVVSDDMPTVSIAVPGSIIDNAQSLELATRLAGQIARAATIFRVDEVVVFDSQSTQVDESSVLMEENSDENESGAAFLTRILMYLETPQYLRRSLFPKHYSLRFVGLLPPLDAPHHLRKHEWAPYREGVTLKGHASASGGTLVDVGLSKNVTINQAIEPGKRVTVAMGKNRHLDADVRHEVVSSSKPRQERMYWGYKVRYASNLSSVFKNSPYKGGYDYLIGTSEHGVVVKASELALPSFRHLLIAFGGLAGLEECVEEVNELKGKNVCKLFDLYLNLCPNQGSRTIRTEEAIFICLQYFQEPINRVSPRYEHAAAKSSDWS